VTSGVPVLCVAIRCSGRSRIASALIYRLLPSNKPKKSWQEPEAFFFAPQVFRIVSEIFLSKLEAIMVFIKALMQ